MDTAGTATVTSTSATTTTTGAAEEVPVVTTPPNPTIVNQAFKKHATHSQSLSTTSANKDSNPMATTSSYYWSSKDTSEDAENSAPIAQQVVKASMTSKNKGKEKASVVDLSLDLTTPPTISDNILQPPALLHSVQASNPEGKSKPIAVESSGQQPLLTADSHELTVRELELQAEVHALKKFKDMHVKSQQERLKNGASSISSVGGPPNNSIP
ncbi:hypothetical protein FRB90_009681 [Tulasnella sp. 427]|nr:hypothetical protein FRB90_009681 [Tulasnella sp. 427]